MNKKNNKNNTGKKYINEGGKYILAGASAGIANTSAGAVSKSINQSAMYTWKLVTIAGKKFYKLVRIA